MIESGPLDAPGPGQLLVAVEATGISYAEQAMRRGRYFGQPEFPFVPGYDLVGTVLQVGPQADTSLAGKRVAVLTKTGGWASHAVVEARDSVIVPAGIDPADAETVVVNGVTAWQMLHRAARVKPGQTILVHGASGGVGGILIQLAQHARIRVIGAASPGTTMHSEQPASNPSTTTIRTSPTASGSCPPRGVDAVFDNIGGPMMRVSYGLLAPRGALVCYAIIAGVSGTGGLVMPFVKAVSRVLLWNALPNGHRARFYDLWAGHKRRPARFRKHLEEDLGHVFTLLADGSLKANIAARFPLDDVASALALAESRTVNGKIILLP
jgi:NADPH:quinone reductase-like Zn-dependent oxidoreductase